ncbi:MAG: 30S ribosomal protein S2 [Candidatus Wildermuthbacteria bacterium]|nr:30S ribosomal protein S2 [Candidatus Wildermuthbacteria bacterium]
MVNGDPIIEEMTGAGLQFGHKTSKTHPKMKPFIAGIRNTVHIFNLEKTKEKLDEALQFISGLAGEGKVLLLVGTKVQIKNLAKETAIACSIPFVTERWLGGTFTNFETISKRITELIDLEKKKEAGEFAKYTKKEQAGFEERIKELELKYGGLRALTKVPEAVFICDLDENGLVLREAKKKGISVIAICDSNIDPTLVDYCIPANDDAQSAVRYILDRVKSTLSSGRVPSRMAGQIPENQNG